MKTPEALLAERYLAVKEVEKLMGRHTFLHLQLKNREEMDTLWCSPENQPTLTTNYGTYRGYDEVFGWYVNEFEKRAAAGDAAMQENNPLLQGYDPSEFHGAGTFMVDTVTTPIVEIAGDMQTAKGWFCGSAITTEIVEGKPSARWTWKKYGVDFILEKGKWKLWHLRMLTEFSVKPGKTWLDGNDELPSGSLPSDRSFTRELYSPSRLPANEPRIPEPYMTFDVTFSY